MSDNDSYQKKKIFYSYSRLKIFKPNTAEGWVQEVGPNPPIRCPLKNERPLEPYKLRQKHL